MNGELSIFNLMLTPEYVAALTPLLKLSTSPCPPHSFVGKEESTPAVTHLRLAPGALDRVGPLLSALAVELRRRPGYGQTYLWTGLILQIHGLLERYGEAHRDPDSPARGDAGLLTAIRYIEEHYAEPLTIHDLGQQSGYAPTSLARKFRHLIGMPPSDYVLQLRLQHACTLLATTDLSIATVALNVGFSGSRYFAARFREVMGVTPSTFRTQNQDRFTNTQARIVAS